MTKHGKLGEFLVGLALKLIAASAPGGATTLWTRPEPAPISGRVVLTLLKQHVEDYRAEYDEEAQDFRALDQKAQGTVAVSGIFIAAVFAFVRQIPEDPTLSRPLVFGLLGSAVLLLLASVLFALQALRVRDVTARPSGDDLGRFVDHLLDLSEDEAMSRLADFYGELRARWQASVAGLAEDNGRKARALERAQSLLGLAIGIVGLLTIAVMCQKLFAT